jgi:DNA (cytosine-5)-methyltransferase 1
MLQLAKGRALAIIVDELERLGYRWAYRVVDSRAFGLPQRRERVFVLATLDGDPRSVVLADDAVPPEPRPEPLATACGFYWTEGTRGLGWAVDSVPTLKCGSTVGIPAPPAILMPSREIVKPDIRDAERMQGFEIDWTKPSERVAKHSHRWKLVGNAVTVDVAHWIGLRLRYPGYYDASNDVPITPSKPWPRAAWSDGRDRYVSWVSTWPMRNAGIPLHRFLRFPGDLLSAKATGGFLSRARNSRLRFPKGFLEAVEVHLNRMKTHEGALWEEANGWPDR